MKKINTGHDLIHFYEDVLTKEVCQKIKDFIFNQKNLEANEKHKMPWETSDTIDLYRYPKDSEIIKLITENIKTITKLACESFNIEMYPHFTDLVLWKTGRKMGIHIDNGDMHPEGSELSKMFEPRHYSAVVYINDDYEGGHTLVMNEDRTKVIYESKPKTGAVLFFTSDSRCPHGVSQITGNRVTLPTWFTTNINFKDRLD
ncbi:MAG: 2OG-Fe(II) oxygenase [Terrimicrobiaceae bacterium]